MIRNLWTAFLGSTLGAFAILGCALVWLALSVPSHGGECAGQMVRVSYYGAESGNRTASGKRFDGSQLLAAHKSLPFGTRVRFTYAGRSIVLPIEDRGPYIRGRTYDLSRAAASRLGFIREGVVSLCAERV